MGLRFRKSIKILPGVKVNISRNGFSSISVGGRGGSMSFGKNGTYANTSLPGTGLSFRNKVGDVQKKDLTQNTTQQEVPIKISIDDNGAVSFKNQDDVILPNSIVSKIWQSNGETITNYLKDAIIKFNDMELINAMQLDIPFPNQEPVYEKLQFDTEEPQQPIKANVKKPFFLTMLISAKAKDEYNNEFNRTENDYQEAIKKWKTELEEWNRSKEEYEKHQQKLYDTYSTTIRMDINLMISVLEDTLQNLEWPRETNISFEITNDGSTVWIDTDLPEIEDLPQKIATLAASGKRLNIKEKTQKQLNLEYAQLIYAIALRIAAYTFASLPSINTVVLSGFSQRLDTATGKINDEYLYSIKFIRNVFSDIDFTNLKQLDPVASFERFENIRKMSAANSFKTIEPFEIKNIN